MKKRINIKQKGFVLASIIVTMPFLILIAASFSQLAVSNLRLAKTDQYRTHAQMAADAGSDIAAYQLNLDSNWTGTSSPVQLVNSNGIRTTYEVSISNLDDDNKAAVSTGKVYINNKSTPDSTISTQTKLRAVRSSGYSIVSGVGGLFLSNSAKVIGGNVLVNGEISLSNTAQIGLSNNAVNVDVAHQNCPVPANATYPRLCNSGENGQPISITNSARIFGDVKANNQISGAGMSNPGLTASSGVAPQPLPTHDRTAQKNAVSSEITATSASCSSGTRNWGANTKITGNVNISGSCRVTINGDVWITGTLTVRNSAQIIVSPTVNTDAPDIMVDGSSAQFSNTSSLTHNSLGTGMRIITYWSRASCSPECTNVTSTDLYNSRNDETISLSNSAQGPKVVFYAKWTRVTVNNSGNIGALIGQTVELKNSGTITFGADAGVGGPTHWVISENKRLF